MVTIKLNEQSLIPPCSQSLTSNISHHGAPSCPHHFPLYMASLFFNKDIFKHIPQVDDTPHVGSEPHLCSAVCLKGKQNLVHWTCLWNLFVRLFVCLLLMSRFSGSFHWRHFVAKTPITQRFWSLKRILIGIRSFFKHLVIEKFASR